MTFAEYKTEVRSHLLQYNRAQGVQTYIDVKIKAYSADLQRALPWYQVGNDTSKTPGQHTAVGQYVMKGDLPLGRDFRFSLKNATDEVPLVEVAWSDFDPYIAGDMYGRDRVFCIKPQGHTYMICPPLQADETLRIRYDGVKIDYADGDTVPFDSLFAEAVANGVLGELVRKVDNDQNTYISYMRSYGRLKAGLIADNNAVTRSQN